MLKPLQFYKLIITAPDGRFGQIVEEGGIDKNLKDHLVKKYRELGQVVKVFKEAAVPPIVKIDVYSNSVFKDIDEYYTFATKYRVWGGDAIKLKTKMDKLADLRPKIRSK